MSFLQTASTITFLLHQLALNQQVQDKLYADIDRHLPMDRVLTEAALKRMSYLKACVKESMRYTYPIVIGTERIIQEDVVIKDYFLPKGVCVFFKWIKWFLTSADNTCDACRTLIIWQYFRLQFSIHVFQRFSMKIVRVFIFFWRGGGGMGVLHHPFWLQLVLALFRHDISMFYYMLYLAKDNWLGLHTRQKWAYSPWTEDFYIFGDRIGCKM